MTDTSVGGSVQFDLPKDLLAEAKRQPKPQVDELKIDGWRNSWVSRLSEMLLGKDR